MCYIIITGGSLVWFLLSLIADMLIATAIVTPKWLIGPAAHTVTLTRSMHLYDEQQNQQQQQQQQQQALDYNNMNMITITTTTTTSTTIPTTTALRYPSVGIYTRCKVMNGVGYHCGPFDLDGFATDSSIYPTAWKAAMFFISLGFILLTVTVFCTLWSCCRQSVFGKSLHNMTACAQVIAGISVMLSLFLHPLAWSAPRVLLLCGSDAEPFYSAGCSVGVSFYCAVLGVLLCFICAGISVKAESSNLRTRVKRRIEAGERLVCIP